MHSVTLTSNEIEVACDALWFAERHDGLDPDGRRLWERLQQIRHGDYGGGASVELTTAEVRVVQAALSRVESDGDIDPASAP